jgi:hypothetical protein
VRPDDDEVHTVTARRLADLVHHIAGGHLDPGAMHARTLDV